MGVLATGATFYYVLRHSEVVSHQVQRWLIENNQKTRGKHQALPSGMT